MNYYAEAIDILMYQKCNYEQLLIEIAKQTPAAIVNAFKVRQKASWIDEVRPLYAAGKKIEAIKRCRELTGMSLKDAKEAVESIRI